MPHIRSCLLIAEGAIVGGAALVAVVRHALHLRRGTNYSLANALGSGAVGGLLGAAAGTALCVVRDGTANPGGGWVAAWLFRLLPFGGLGIVEGAVVGLVVGIAMAWIVARSTRGSARAGMPPSA
jgi:hypothetical protein